MVKDIVLGALYAGWWDYSWYPSPGKFTTMVVFMFWWGLALVVALIPLSVIALFTFVIATARMKF